MRKIVFEESAFQDFAQWAAVDKKLYQRLVGLITEVVRNPFSGIGKPEPLKYEMKGFWSRRINDEHRLVYKVTDDSVIIVACKNHYE